MYTKESIVNLLNTSDLAVERGIQAIYSRQTLDEQASETTKHVNGVGFSGADAEILSSFAQQIERKLAGGVKAGHCLSEKQMVIARKKIVRYSRQLIEVADAKTTCPEVKVGQPAIIINSSDTFVSTPIVETKGKNGQPEEDIEVSDLVWQYDMMKYLDQEGHKTVHLWNEVDGGWTEVKGMKVVVLLNSVMQNSKVINFVVSEDGPVAVTVKGDTSTDTFHLKTFLINQTDQDDFLVGLSIRQTKF